MNANDIKQPNANADRYNGADVLRKAAERMRRDGRTATAIMLDNAAWLAEGHELAELRGREREGDGHANE